METQNITSPESQLFNTTTFVSQQLIPQIYVDNAATTKVSDEVIETILPFLKEYFGNPSSLHSHGRITREAIENARKIIATHLSKPS